MKKFLCSIIFLALGFTSSYGQGDIRLGINAGIPVGDAGDISNFNIGGDVAYLMGFGDTFQLGPMVGYTHFFGEDVDLGEGMGSFEMDDIQFLPIAATARFGLAGLELGADLGYALGISDGNDGGFYYKPKVGFSLFGLGLIASYTGISVDGGTFSTVNLGLEFRL
ncbi:hypothetical protein [Salinimicrobium oceani]|uniref:Outer membrane protein beta-barrel domain-containing protein n=1 Tax=Salinimicrobium oceani TaxID=2722702 RepID=A0ABX1D257_9FLAO|nr:hypothetical protein [Salinimicrobium oceani]NJW52631.1 hypothetical protein [Salinimicrobium oceani]